MEQLQFFGFLLLQSTFLGCAFLAIGPLGVALLLSERKDRLALVCLPLIWLAPLVLGSLFLDSFHGMKTAGWVQYAALGAFVAVMIAGLAGLILAPKGQRAVSAAWLVANMVVAFMAWFILAMASAGSWL